MSTVKATLLESLIAYLVRRGVADVSLRPMAAAVGTSARLLIFHFGSKERLLLEAEERKRGQSHLDAILDQSGQVLETQQGDLAKGDASRSLGRSSSVSASIRDWGAVSDEEDEDEEDGDEDEDLNGAFGPFGPGGHERSPPHRCCAACREMPRRRAMSAQLYPVGPVRRAWTASVMA